MDGRTNPYGGGLYARSSTLGPGGAALRSGTCTMCRRSASAAGQIADHILPYDAGQLPGVMNLLQGRMFERSAVLAANGDGTAWVAELHQDRSVPGSDEVVTIAVSGERVEVRSKARVSESYVGSAPLMYPCPGRQPTEHRRNDR